MWGYTRALGILREVVSETGDKSSDVPSTHAYWRNHFAGGRGEVPQRSIQREGRCKPSEFFKTYIRNNPEDGGIVSRELL